MSDIHAELVRDTPGRSGHRGRLFRAAEAARDVARRLHRVRRPRRRAGQRSIPGSPSVALLAIAVGAGAAGALNMWYDADIDAVMRRTAKRRSRAARSCPAKRWASA